MTREQQYFLDLISSHLNNSTPKAPIDINLSELFRICELQNMTAIATIELKKLLKVGIISKKKFSPFNQVLGLTVQNYEFKIEGIERLKKTLCENKIEHLFLKGAAIREFYPVPQVRTSGDTDVVVTPQNLERATDLLCDKGFKIKQQSGNQSVLTYHDEEFQIKSYVDTLNERCEGYFNDVFGVQSDCENKYSFTLKPTFHLLYVVTHILKHFKSGGAGIRQLADVDVLLRSGKVDFDNFISTCEELGIIKSASVLLAFSKEYFSTPIDFEFNIEPELKSRVENVMLNGGTFGYGIGNIGTARLMNTMVSDSKNASVRAFFSLFSFNKKKLLHTYKYAREHRILLPLAYLNRLYDAVFKRGKQNVNNIKSIFNDKEIASEMSEMLKELEINE